MYTKRDSLLEVLKLYTGDYTQEFYLREIARLTKMPLKTTQNAVLVLEEYRILKSTVHGRNKYFALNLHNIAVKYSLVEAEIYKTLLFLEKNPLLKVFLKEFQNSSLLLLFGSFVNGATTKDSDLDLLFLGKEDFPSYLLPYTLHTILLNESSFLKAIQSQETLIKEIEEKHILLNNHSFYVESMWRFYGQ
ncbi:nucleotidyltransferase domain-containing protein [Candidatus Woesearchaeota archaeon]|nr:nucleotidyltransferase domain-containing protein [Candidatus Woesearchaeota archaeon]